MEIQAAITGNTLPAEEDCVIRVKAAEQLLMDLEVRWFRQLLSVSHKMRFYHISKVFMLS